jgi:tetratricopeptide (TPR) repeat protein
MVGLGIPVRIAVSLLSCLSLLVGPDVPPPSSQSRAERNTTYLQLLLRYRRGEIEPVVREVATWDAKQLAALRSTSVMTLNEPGSGSLGEKATLVETAVALHTRMAARRAEALTADSPHGHLDLARYLVEHLATNTPSASFVRRWHITVSDYLGGASPSIFLRYADTVNRLYRSDPDALLSLGMGFERVADAPFKPSSQSTVFASPEAATPPPDAEAAIPEQMERRRWLDIVASFYRRAIAQAAGNMTARLRLGRVLALSGEYRLALQELALVEQHATGTMERHLAALYEGLALDGLHHETEAAEAYRRARRLVPVARSSTFALSEIEHRRGNLREAAGIIEEFAARQPQPRLEEDPWWVLQNDWRRRVDTGLDALDNAVKQ